MLNESSQGLTGEDGRSQPSAAFQDQLSLHREETSKMRLKVWLKPTESARYRAIWPKTYHSLCSFVPTLPALTMPSPSLLGAD